MARSSESALVISCAHAYAMPPVPPAMPIDRKQNHFHPAGRSQAARLACPMIWVVAAKRMGGQRAPRQTVSETQA